MNIDVMLPSTYNASSMLRSDYGPLERIGSTDSVVFRGRGNDGQFVALRFLACDVAPVRSALIDLVQTASLIRHPMLAAVGGCQSFSGGGLCIVSEFVPGQPLDRWIAAHGLPSLRMTVDFVRRLCLGLHAMHQRALVHGAVHPGNLMVLSPDTRPGGRIVAKLLDVGVPAWLRTWPPRASAMRYLAPELVRATFEAVAPASAHSDVFACGGLLYQLCTGEAPIPVPSAAQLMAANHTLPLPRPSQINPQLPAALEYVILRALAIEPNHRLTNTAELATALGHVEAEWGNAGLERGDAADGGPTPRARRHTSHDALTPVVNPRSLRAANANASSSQASTVQRSFVTALPRGVAYPGAANAPVAPPEPPITPAGKRSLHSPHVRARAAIATSGHYPKLDWHAKRRSSVYGLGLVALTAAGVLYVSHLASNVMRPAETAAMPALKANPSHPGAAAADVPPVPSAEPSTPPASNIGAPVTARDLRPAQLARNERALIRPRSRPRRAREAHPERDSESVRPAESDSAAPPSAAVVSNTDSVERKPSDMKSAASALEPQVAPPQAAETQAPESRIAQPSADAAHAATELTPARAPEARQIPPAKVPKAPAPQPIAASALRAVEITDVNVRGSLSASVLRRALERIRPQLQRCVREHGGQNPKDGAQILLSATIDEIGRARTPSVSGATARALNECLLAAASKLVTDKPDTGTVKVSWALR